MLLARYFSIVLPAALLAGAVPADAAQPFRFSAGGPDGLIGTASGTPNEAESADDFVLQNATRLTGGSFTGLLPRELQLSAIASVNVELYRVFPGDSANPPSGRVPTRVNSPGDVAFKSFDSTDGSLSYTSTIVGGRYTVANSVVTGINALPGQLTGGEGPVTGSQVRLDFNFSDALRLDAGHYFFRPGVVLNNGDFLWLSAAKPITAPGTPFDTDLQSWIRNEALAPDWLRIGTDITGTGPFNAAFSLNGSTVPEPASWAMMIGGFGLVGGAMRRNRLAARPRRVAA